MLAPGAQPGGRLKLPEKLPDARAHREAFYIFVPTQSVKDSNGSAKQKTAAVGCGDLHGGGDCGGREFFFSASGASQLAIAAASRIVGAGAAVGANSAGQRSDTE